MGFLDNKSQGLAFLHDRHLLHRDIKPSNILMTRSGDVKVRIRLPRRFALTQQRRFPTLEFPEISKVQQRKQQRLPER